MFEKLMLKGLISRTVLMGLTMVASGVWAETVTRDEAVAAVGNWLSYRPQLGCRFGAAVSGARTCSTTNGVAFHVVKLEGGGFVVTSGDTESEPIVAFSESDDLVESDQNPLWVMLRRDFAAQGGRARLTHAATANNSAAATASVTTGSKSAAARKWARLLPAKGTNGVMRLSHAASGVETISDVRVAPLLETKWNQSQDSLYSNRGSPCYNYYTPNNWPCGCVATATAQVMRYHKHPTDPVTPGTYACSVGGVRQDLTMQGGMYDWANMPAVPANGTTLAQRQAIGKLTSDIGISCLATYRSGSSSIGGYMPVRCLPERFGYASAEAVCDNGGLALDLVQRVLRSNLDAKLPVIAGLSGSGGHGVVADGYGYSMSTFYVHLNLGWGGMDDAWYALPSVTTSWYSFWSVDTLVFNICPTGVADGVICSGRILNSGGSPVGNATVTAKGSATVTATSDAHGIYAFVLSPGAYLISSGNASKSVTLEANVGTHVYDDGMYSVSPYAVNNLCDVDLTVTGDEPEVTTHAVTFVLGEHGTRTGGGALTQTVEDGAAATAPTVEASAGWTFKGWDKAFDAVTADLTVTAQYEEDIDTDSLTVYDDIDEARLAAMREGKLIFLVSGATWCPYTVELQQYIADAGSTFTDSYVYLWHDGDEDAFGIAATASIPQFWIFTPSTFSLSTKDSWDSTALFVLRGCPSTYSYFLNIIKQYADKKPDKANVATIRFDVNDGWFHSGATTSILDGKAYAASGTMEDQEYVVGQDVTLRLNGYVRDGFTFGGWAAAPDFAAAYADGDTIRADVLPTDEDGLTFYAVWNAKTVTVTFDYQGWSGASQNKKSKTFACGYRLDNLPIETSTDDVIEGWHTAPASGLQVDASTWVPTEDTTYYLHWHHKTCTIAYNANGGDGLMSDQPFTLGIGQSLSPNQFSREGYTFGGWAKSSNGEVVYSDGQTVLQPTVADGDKVTLYAIWVQDVVEIVTHTVTFVLGEHGARTGGGALTQTVEDGAAATAPAVEALDGWTFTGWDKAFDSVTADLTVTAQYEEVSPVNPVDPEDPEDPEEIDAHPAGENLEIAAPETTLTGTIRWSAKNLPKGLKISSQTGVISGTPTAPGTYTVKVTAKSGKTSETFDVEVAIANYRDELLPLDDGYDAQVGVKTLIELGEKFAGAKASGLPSGLKFAARDVTDKDFGDLAAGTIYGVPSKVATNCVIFTLKEGKVTHTASAAFAVAAAPAWSVGTFNGRLGDRSGSATLTVAASGKISGKVIAGGRTWSFSASGYGANDDRGVESHEIAATAKSGKLAAYVLLDVSATGAEGSISSETVDEEGVPVIDAPLELWRNEWKDAGATDKLKDWVGLYTVQLDADDAGTGYLSLTLDAKGNCKATGKLPDGTSASATLPLVWDAEAEAPMAIWQIAPGTYMGGHVGGLLTWTRSPSASEDGTDEDESTRRDSASTTVTGDDIVWANCAPTATAAYGEGFVRALTASGAYYNKLAALAEYYQAALAFGAEAPVLDVTVKTTDFDENGKRTTTSEQTAIDAIEPGCWGGLTVSFSDRGAAIVNQGKATKPVKVDGEWMYEGANDAALAFSLAKATGVFKGSFTCWYDYTSAHDYTKDPAKETLTHTSKKVSYEGVMVLGEPLRGFCLWDRTGTYGDEKTGKEKTYKYKESKLVVFE